MTQTITAPAAAPTKRRRRGRTLTRRDKIVAACMLGIPLLLDLGFVWIPALGSIFLSFTKWTGVGSIHLQSCSSFPSVPGIPQPGCLYGVENYLKSLMVVGWTSSSEMVGELGQALLALDAPAALKEAKQRCLQEVRKVWPHIKARKK